MTVFDPLLPAFRAMVKANAEGVYARIGKLEAAGTFTLQVPGRANFVYVRLNGETQNVQEAINLKVQVRPDMPVRIRRNEAGVWEIIDVYPQETSAALGNAAPAMNRPPADGDGVQETVGARNYKPGRVKLSGTDNLTIQVEPFDYWFHGSRRAFTGGTLDLASNRPSTSGAYAWVQVYVDPVTNTLAAETGSEYALRTFLTPAERAMIDIRDGVPVDAVILRNGQTSAPVESDFAFSRTLLHGSPAHTVFVSTDDATVADTTTETSLIGSGEGTLTIPANTLAPGRVYRLYIQGYLSDTGNPTLDIKCTLGGTEIVSTGAFTLNTNITDAGYESNIDFVCRTAGATGTVVAHGLFDYDNGTLRDMTKKTATTIDTTVDNAIDVTVTWGTASASNTITGQITIVECLR